MLRLARPVPVCVGRRIVSFVIFYVSYECPYHVYQNLSCNEFYASEYSRIWASSQPLHFPNVERSGRHRSSISPK